MLDIYLLLLIIATAVTLFVTDKFSVDLIAMFVLGALLILKLVSPAEAVSGFSSSATITIGAMFVLSAGLLQTGVIDYIAYTAERNLKDSNLALLAFIFFVAGPISAIINNTAVVVVFLPVVLRLARKKGISPSKFLIPLSYAAILGGSCTLIGTSTNLIVSSVAANHGLGEFRMFEFSKIGLILFLCGTLYVLFLGRRILPHRASSGALTKNFRMRRYLTEVTVEAGSPMIGKTLIERGINERYDVNILEIMRDKEKIWQKLRAVRLQPGDTMLVRGGAQEIISMAEGEGLLTLSEAKLEDNDLQAEDLILVEAVIAPNSRLIGHTVKEINFRQRYGAFVLAIQSHGRTMRSKIANIPLHFGDALLIQGNSSVLHSLKTDQDFLMMEEVEIERFKRNKAFLSIGIIIAAVLLAALNILPIMVSAILGAVVMVASGCLTIKDAYASIDWMVIFLLAGMIPLGLALENTGAARMLADMFMKTFQGYGPQVMMSALFLLTVVLTEVLTNNATAILLAPIAISLAQGLGVSPKPFLFAIMFAASASFMTPIGYQTNTLVYGPGRYKFTDYMKVGAPLTLITWLTVTFLVPIFWEF